MKQFGRLIVCCTVFLGLVAAALYMLGGKQYEFSASIDVESDPDLVFAAISPIQEKQSGYVGTIRADLSNEIIQEIPGQWQSLTSRSNLYDAITAYQISATDNGTQLKQVTYVQYKGVYRILAPLLREQSQQAAEDSLAQIAQSTNQPN